MQMAGVVTLPEKVIQKIKTSILPQWKACFWSAMVVGLIAHIYKLTNWLPNWDSLVFRYDAQNMLAIGRWFLPVVSAPSSYYDLPFINGLLAIVFFALGAVCICRMFKVQKTVTAVLIGAVVVSFPSVTSVLTYNYVADAYAFSFFLSCVAAWLLTREKPRFLAASLLITLSVGIYQAYVTVTIMLLLCYLIMGLLQQQTTVKTILQISGVFLASGVLGMGLYYGVLLVLLKLTGTTLLDYQGASSTATLAGIDLFGSLYTIKETLVGYFFDFSNGLSVFSVLNVAVFAIAVGLYTVILIKRKSGVLKALVVCVLVVLLPLGACALSFINSGVDYHNLMTMGFVAFYLLLILLYEQTDFDGCNFHAVKQWVILALVALLVCNHAVIANVSYHKLNMAYEKSYGTLIRIADRIEQAEGADQCNRILVLGALDGSEAYSAVLPPNITGTTDGFVLRADDEVVGQSVMCSALNDYCGTAYTFVAGEEKTTLMQKIKADTLPCWPHKESIQVVDEVIVVKLSD